MYNYNNNNFLLIFLLFIIINFCNSQQTTTLTYYVSSTDGTNDPTTCGTTIETACKSILNILNIYNTTYPNGQSSDTISLTILLGDGEYSGIENTNLNIFNMSVTISPVSDNSKQVIFNGGNTLNSNRVFNIIEPLLIKTNTTTIVYGKNSTSLTLNNLNFINFNTSSSNSNSGSVDSSDDDDDDDDELIIIKNNIGYGGIVFMDILNSSLTLTIYGCNFNNNIADRGGVFYLQSQYSNIYDVNVLLQNSVFQSNKAISSYGIGILSWFNNFKVENCKFQESTTSKISGVSTLSLRDGGIVLISNSSFINNQYGMSTLELVRIENGGNGSTISDCLFKDNDVAGFGGGIAMYSSLLSIENCDFINNYAGTLGGAIFTRGVTSYLLINKVNFINNKSAGKGGAISIQTSNYAGIRTSVFSNNTASVGGSINLEHTEHVYILNSTFTNNKGDDLGGAIYTTYTNVGITDCSITNNVAQEGGAIYCSASTLNIITTGSNGDSDSPIPMNGNTDLGNNTHSYEYKGDDGIKTNDYNIYCSLSPSYTFCTVIGDSPYNELCGESIIIEHDGLSAGAIAGIVIGCAIGSVFLFFAIAWGISKTTVADHFIRLRSSSSPSQPLN